MKLFLSSGFSLCLAACCILLSPSFGMAQNQMILHQGRVLLQDGGRVVPMTRGRVGVSDERSQMYDSTEIRQDGTYEINLRANQRSVVQVLLREYNFNPSRAVFFPSENHQIPDFIATPKVEGSIEVSVKRHPQSSANPSLEDQRFSATDAGTGRKMATFRVDRQGRFSVKALEGTQVIIEALPNRNLQWIPPKFTATITREPQKTEFVYLSSSEVGTGNLDLSKDRNKIPDVIDVTLQLADLNRGKLIVGDEVELKARPGRGAPNDSRYTFLIRYDNERNFRTLANQQAGRSLRFTVDRPGGFESKVALFSRGAELGEAAIRSYAVASPNDEAPGVKFKDITPAFPFLIGPLPDGWHMELRFTSDQVAGPVRQPRRLQLDAWAKNGEEAYRLPRQRRRLTFLARHEDDSQWTIVQQNVPTLEWSWTPSRQGKWTLRVDYVPKGVDPSKYSDMDCRAQISFTATGPSAVSSASSGLTAGTPPSSRPARPPIPASTPRPVFRPAPIAKPTAAPRPVLRPVATPKPKVPSRPVLRPFATPKPTPRSTFPPISR